MTNNRGKHKFDRKVWASLMREYRSGIPFWNHWMRGPKHLTRKKKLARKTDFQGGAGAPNPPGKNGAR